MPKGYSLAQISLHWIVALLVLAQFLNDEAIGAAWRAIRRGEAAIPGGFLVTAHVVVGIAILALMLWRLGLRLTRGAPAAPAEEPAALRLAAGATHVLLYVLLLVVPLTGLAAWYGGVAAAGELHELGKTLLMLLVFLHIAGALYQRFVLKSDAVARMLRPEG
ncbi:MAG: cytochrome b/b6 domain-containing protein [Amaricoccus sp.]